MRLRNDANDGTFAFLNKNFFLRIVHVVDKIAATLFIADLFDRVAGHEDLPTMLRRRGKMVVREWGLFAGRQSGRFQAKPGAVR